MVKITTAMPTTWDESLRRMLLREGWPVIDVPKIHGAMLFGVAASCRGVVYP